MTAMSPDTILALGALMSLWTAAIKNAIELRIKPDNPAHDAVIRTLPVLTAVLLSLAQYLMSTQHLTLAGSEDAAKQGLAAGLTAIVMYHGVAGKKP